MIAFVPEAGGRTQTMVAASTTAVPRGVEVSVSTGKYTAEQVLEFAATLIAAANVASGYSEDGEEAML